MTQDPVAIACTLSPADLRARRDDIARLTGAALQSRRTIPRGQLLTFSSDAATEERLRALVAAEAECCAFLHMDLRRDRDHLQLEVTGPADAMPVIEQLLA